MWIYWRVIGETVTWHVGYMWPSGDRATVEEYADQNDAREAVHYLNGGTTFS